MPTGIVIPVVEEERISRVEVDHFTDYQKVIGGYFQVIELANPSASLYMDEEGKMKGLPLNHRATLLMWLHNPAFRQRDYVCGPALLLGQPDRGGVTQSVPQSLEALLFGTVKYKFEVQTVDDPDAWNSNQKRYDDWVDAYNEALSLAERWMAVERVRVVPA